MQKYAHPLPRQKIQQKYLRFSRAMVPIFIIIFVVFYCSVISHTLSQKFENVLVLITSQAQYAIKLKFCAG